MGCDVSSRKDSREIAHGQRRCADGPGAAAPSSAPGPSATADGTISLIIGNKALHADVGTDLGRLRRCQALKGYAQGLAKYAISDGKNEQITQWGWQQRDCGHQLKFERHSCEERSRLVKGSFCNLRSCPFCQHARATKVLAAYTPRILVHGAGRQLRWAVLTVPNTQDLSESLDRLLGGLKRFTRRVGQANRRKSATGLSGLLGGVGQIEVTWNADAGTYHPHYHGIWINDGAPDYVAWGHAWEQSCEYPGAWRKFGKFKADEAGLRGAERVQRLSLDFREMLKYSLKFGGMPPQQLWEAMSVMQGRQLLRSFGCLRNVTVGETLEDAEPDQLPEVDATVFRWLAQWFPREDKYRLHAGWEPVKDDKGEFVGGPWYGSDQWIDFESEVVR